jgi:hypothetical protein
LSLLSLNPTLVTSKSLTNGMREVPPTSNTFIIQ